MKKKYFAPEMEIIKIETTKFLAASDRDIVDDPASTSGEDYSNALAPEFVLLFD